jgi:2-keto-3-deoxy-galactonokinase
MVNSAFTALQDIHGAAMINAIRLAHQSAQNSRMKTLSEYVLGMFTVTTRKQLGIEHEQSLIGSSAQARRYWAWKNMQQKLVS